jgi:hypothetical protein
MNPLTRRLKGSLKNTNESLILRIFLDLDRRVVCFGVRLSVSIYSTVIIPHQTVPHQSPLQKNINNSKRISWIICCFRISGSTYPLSREQIIVIAVAVARRVVVVIV